MENSYYLNGNLSVTRPVASVLDTYANEVSKLAEDAFAKQDMTQANSYLMRVMIAREIMDHLITDEDDLTDANEIEKAKELPPFGKIYISDIGEINMRNMCCASKPVMVQEVRHNDGSVVYNCHCQCGLWCTQAYENVYDAVKEYERMNKKRTTILKK